MYVIKNAIKNLIRNKGRNGLIAIIVLTMITTIAISITINATTNEVINSYKNRFGAEVTIIPNIDKLRAEIEKNPGNMDSLDTLSMNKQIEFSKSILLKESKMSATSQVVASGLKGIGEDEYNKRSKSYPKDQVIGGSNSYNKTPNVTINGYTENNIPKDFKDGLIIITSGKMYKIKGEVIVGEAFAKLNNLKVGDKVEVSDSEDSNKKITLKITGIYKDLRKEEPGYIPSQNNRNDIFTTFETLADFDALYKGKGSIVNGEATFFLKNPGLLEEFTKELRANGLSDKYDVITDEASYNNIVAPVNGLKKVSTMFMIGIMVFGSIVLVLLSILSIRERKYEIGVLRAMGMPKSKLVIGFISENIIIVTLCLIAGLGIGAVSSKPVSDILLKEQITVIQQKELQNNQFGAIVQPVNQEEFKALENLDVRLTLKSALEVSVFAIILALLTSVISVYYAAKYEPIKILSERN